MASQAPASPASSSNERIARLRAERELRGTIGRARFTKLDVHYDPIGAKVTIGLWLVDRSVAERTGSGWPIHRATLHWRRHDITIHSALNFEFQIDEEVPYSTLTAAELEPNIAVVRFGDAMRITVGVSGLRLTRTRSESVRTDWAG